MQPIVSRLTRRRQFVDTTEAMQTSRREALRMFGLSSLLSMLPGSVLAGTKSNVNSFRKCILIWLDGGPSHIDTFDPKPEAPAEVRGPFESIQTAIPGIQISELLPRLAERLDQTSLIRSMTSPLGEHNLGTQYLLTGYQPSPAIDYATYGSVLAASQSTDNPMPSFVSIPHFRVGGSTFSGSGFLPSIYGPFSAGDASKPNFEVPGLTLPAELDNERLERRQRFQKMFNGSRKNEAFEQAFSLIHSQQMRDAFALDHEQPALRNRYGRKSIGQYCILARRLIERGVSLVTINHRGWDTHDDSVTRLRDGFAGAKTPVGLVPSLDQAVASLIDDLRDRHLLDSTLVIVMGEFGRTPKLNVRGGRDHWPRVFSVLLAGGGSRPGTIVGASDALGESPAENPVTPADLAWTIYHLLGLNPKESLPTPDGRTIQIGAPHGQLIESLV